MIVTHIKEFRPSNEQETAIDMCCDTSIRIAGVTGGAGTGKTSVLRQVFNQLKAQGRRAVLTAPTGRAAKRITELTGIKAVTIHKLLEFPTPDELMDDEQLEPNKPRRSREKPIDYNAVIVDESSMVGETLGMQLYDALPTGSIIRFFGDNNQLPPVEPGMPIFKNVLEEKPSVTLTFNFRNDDAILSNANNVLRGVMPKRSSRFQIIWSDDPLREAARFVTEEFKRPDHQIIVPTRNGNFGTLRLNPTLQLKFNPQGDSLRLARYDAKHAPVLVRSGDKFLWTKNDYRLNLFNGETGSIEWVNTEDGSLGLVTPDRAIEVPPRIKAYNPYLGHVVNYDPRKQLELGYAITTHKSQGSEFTAVVIVLCRNQGYLLDRNNFYTAITRARDLVVVICDRGGMGFSLRPAKKRD